MKKLKRTISLLLSLVMVLSLNVTSFAANVPEESFRTTVTVMDYTGEYVDYDVVLEAEEEVEIPLFAYKEEDGIQSRSLTAVAKLNIWHDGIYLNYQFVPFPLQLPLTVGFTGELVAYRSGLLYGRKNIVVPTTNPWIKVPKPGTGRLSGNYTVIGYSTISINQATSF